MNLGLVLIIAALALALIYKCLVLREKEKTLKYLEGEVATLRHRIKLYHDDEVMSSIAVKRRAGDFVEGAPYSVEEN